MTDILFVVLIVVVLTVISKRKNKKKQARKRQLEGPARSPEQAEILHHPSDMKSFVRCQRCHCGGRPYILAETTLRENSAIRVAVCECMRCEEIHRFYFQIEYMN